MKKKSPDVIFAQNLSRLRSKNVLTQEKLAEKCGLHWRYVQKLERPLANPSLDVLVRLKAALKCAWKDLLDE